MILTVAAFVAVSFASLANDATVRNIDTINRYKITASSERMAYCLKLDDKQTYWNSLYWDDYKTNMLRAYTENNEDYVPIAVRNNLKRMRNILTQRQYTMYRKLMVNTLINNKFIENEENLPENYNFLKTL